MKIERIEIFGVAMPLVGEFSTSYRAESVQRSAVVRITADDGAIGLGNVDPIDGYSEETTEQTLQALAAVLAPRLIGLDPTNVNRVLEVLDAAGPALLDAKAALEMACVDLSARAAGVAVHAWLGGAVKEALLFNAWIGILPPERAAAETREWQRRGYRSAKIKVGGDIRADRDRVRAVREAVGPDFALRVDANAGYDADTAIELARLLLPYDLQLFEQPVPADDIAGLARVRREAGGIPIMADESVLDHASLVRIIRAEAADIVKVKVMKQGGILRTRRMIDTAEAAGLRCVLGHGFGLGINTMAEIMTAASARCVIDGLECVGPLKTADDIVADKLDLGAGRIALPPGPGLGVELDQARLDRYRFFFAEARS